MSDARLGRLFPQGTSLEQIARAKHSGSKMIQHCVEALRAKDDSPFPQSAVAFFVPGRIEVLGKHTDYCGGRSLLCAIDRGIAIVAKRRGDQTVRVSDALRKETCEFVISAPLSPAMDHWSNYPATVVRRIAENFGTTGKALSGVEIAFASNLPPAAGLSSSSAFIVSVFLAVASINQLNRSEAFISSIATLEELAHYCGCIENGSAFGALSGVKGVGTSGGSQDHTAILCCKPDKLSQFGFAPVACEAEIVMPAELELVVMQSNVIAEKTGAARLRYNAASDKVRYLVNLWNTESGDSRKTLAQIVRSSPQAVNNLHQMIERSPVEPFPRDQLHDRLQQFVTESEILIPKASRALADADLRSFADAVSQSTSGAVNQLKNQVPETVALVEQALEAGAIAASPFGAGFGGSVWAMVKKDEMERFKERLGPAVRDHLMAARPADGAQAIGNQPQ